jgi:hypothetical protein
MCEMREADALAGLASWCQTLWPPELRATCRKWPPWMAAMLLEAQVGGTDLNQRTNGVA